MLSLLLLQQAEADCQKDLKQIWADKSFHEIAITQVSSVCGLADKAQKCTSDTEMVLTALHSITQLKKLRETEWESIAFTTTVSSTPQFSEGEQIEIDSLGGVVRDTASLCDIQVVSFNYRTGEYGDDGGTMVQAQLGSSLSFQVDVTVPLAKTLVNKRSGKAVNLKTTTTPSLKVIVHYGRSEKELDKTHNISLQQTTENHPNSPYGYTRRRVQVPNFILSTSGDDVTVPEQNLSTTSYYDVAIQALCGGTHTVTFQFGATKKKQSFTVVGQPTHGQTVQMGPDWKAKREVATATPGLPAHQALCVNSSNVVGTVCHHNQQVYNRSGHKQPCRAHRRVAIESDMVTVKHDSGIMHQYKWGKDGEYEIELAMSGILHEDI